MSYGFMIDQFISNDYAVPVCTFESSELTLSGIGSNYWEASAPKINPRDFLAIRPINVNGYKWVYLQDKDGNLKFIGYGGTTAPKIKYRIYTYKASGVNNKYGINIYNSSNQVILSLPNPIATGTISIPFANGETTYRPNQSFVTLNGTGFNGSVDTYLTDTGDDELTTVWAANFYSSNIAISSNSIKVNVEEFNPPSKYNYTRTRAQLISPVQSGRVFVFP